MVNLINTTFLSSRRNNGVEAFLYCQLEGAVGDETVTLARQQSTDIFFFSKVNVVPHKTMRIMLQCSVPKLCAVTRGHVFPTDKRIVKC